MIETRQLFASRNDDETLITGRSGFLPRVRLSYWQLSKEAFNWRNQAPLHSEADVTREVQKEKPCKSLVTGLEETWQEMRWVTYFLHTCNMDVPSAYWGGFDWFLILEQRYLCFHDKDDICLCAEARMTSVFLIYP